MKWWLLGEIWYEMMTFRGNLVWNDDFWGKFGLKWWYKGVNKKWSLHSNFTENSRCQFVFLLHGTAVFTVAVPVFMVSTLLRGRVLSPFFRFCVFFLSLWLWTGWGGWGGMLTFFATARFSCTSTHTSCYAFSCTFRHTSCCATASFSCTFTHTSCYATARFLLHIFTHSSCYATARFLLHFHTYVMLRYC